MIIPLLLLLSGCGGAGGNRTTYEYMPAMMDSPAVKAQEVPMRAPVSGTIPLGFAPYPYQPAEGELAGAMLQNTLAKTMPNFLRGQEVYNTYCMVCHGPTGKGDGTIVPKFPQPPTLHSDKVREWPDGRLYHVISTGQHLMPSYAAKIAPEDRWAVVLYLRALQRAAHPTPDDIERFKQQLLDEAQP